MDPYFTLQIALDADDDAIRRAYLDAVKEATPETDPERFAAISAAFEKIKSADRRRAYEFERRIVYEDTPAGLLHRCLAFHPPARPPDFEFMKSHLRKSLLRPRS